MRSAGAKCAVVCVRAANTDREQRSGRGEGVNKMCCNVTRCDAMRCELPVCIWTDLKRVDAG